MPELHTEKCDRCRGRGIRYFGQPPVASPCKICHGTGERSFANSPEKRERIKARVKERKAKKLVADIEEFITEYPDVYTWLNTSALPFAQSLYHALLKYGHLTERQLSAAQKFVRRRSA